MASPGAAGQVVSAVPSPPPQEDKGTGMGMLAVLIGGITLVMYLQIAGTYKFLHKRNPRIFKKPKLPPFEVLRQHVRYSKLGQKLRELGTEPASSGAKTAANQEANFSGRVNQSYEDEDNQVPNLMYQENEKQNLWERDIPTRPAPFRASTGPRLKTGRQPNWRQRLRRVNRQMRADDAA